MTNLTQEQCVACRKDSPRVTDAEIAALKPQIPAWNIVEHNEIPSLERAYRLKNFAQALDFTNKVGALAEEEGHHPAILTEYGKVTVVWWTHTIKGLHRLKGYHLDNRLQVDVEQHRDRQRITRQALLPAHT
jgi:4a-hydroxytetrahydrobiopterin dehydratase